MLPGLPQAVAAALADQQDMNAVERFSAWHDAGHCEISGGPQAPKYRTLLPASPPGPGQQYAFEVDLDTCTGCKACVAGCHSMNGLAESETWRKVGELRGTTSGLPMLQHVTTACHHCADPGCLNGCPTKAYEKDKVTGIVKHLDDQCIGCRYCEFKCAYGVPQYQPDLGIVRKCDMCTSRLAVGEAPACVQSCPNQAIRIVAADTQELVRSSAESFGVIAHAPDPKHTRPTTVYRSKTKKESLANFAPADLSNLEPEHAHLPLLIMLVATQSGVGALAASLTEFVTHDPLLNFATAATGLFLLLVGLMVAPLHLGRPQHAWRAFLGWRTSWLSREMLAFGPVPMVASVYLLASAPKAWMSWLPPFVSPLLEVDGLIPATGWGTVMSGLAAVFCSVMIYRDTPRELWASHATTVRFLLTAVLMGAWVKVAVSSAGGAAVSDLRPELGIVMGVSFIKLILENRWRRLGTGSVEREGSALLLWGPLHKLWSARCKCAIVGSLLIPAYMFGYRTSDMATMIMVGTGLLLALAGEFLERLIFFKAIAPRRMPGTVR